MGSTIKMELNTKFSSNFSRKNLKICIKSQQSAILLNKLTQNTTPLTQKQQNKHLTPLENHRNLSHYNKHSPFN